ncbi:MAG: thiamine phosphate synthase [Deltaproteobacteria bacterium]|nr:MAG: thiamine phosphate synthase [Deltaproteobacteria bacterium]
MIESLPKLYLITDRKQTYKQRRLFDTVKELLQAGIRMVQLREKDLSAAELYPLARDLRLLTHKYNALLLINDRIDIAQAVGADGVHLGGHSLPIKKTREILGSKALIGVSTHSALEAESAQNKGADFITYGPVFLTPSKAPFGPPVGVNSLQRVCNCCEIPVYALGGVKIDNTVEIMNSGAYGVSMISALLSAPDPNQAVQQFSTKF